MDIYYKYSNTAGNMVYYSYPDGEFIVTKEKRKDNFPEFKRITKKEYLISKI